VARRPADEGGYAAFISYSHAVDGKLAPALQRGLQRFAKRWYELRALKLFRDETSLSTNPHLWASIEDALAKSRHFLLLASPRAARSEWVAREVDWWKANRPLDRLLIVLTQGALTWDHAAGDFLWDEETPLPPNLRGVFTDSPRHLDLRWAQNASTDLSLQHNQFREAIADLAATLHGRPKEELIGEEVTQHRRVRRLARGAMAALVLLALAATGAALWAIQQARIAIEHQQRAYAATVEAERRLAEIVYDRAQLERTRGREDLTLALLYHLASDEQFRTAFAERNRLYAELPRSIGDVMEAKAVPPPWTGTEIAKPISAGLVAGEPAILVNVQDGGTLRKSLQVRGLVSGRTLATLTDAAFNGSLDAIVAGLIVGGQYVLLVGSDGGRQVRRIDGKGGLPLYKALPRLEPLPNDEMPRDASRGSDDGSALLVAMTFDAPRLFTVVTAVLDLETGTLTPVDNQRSIDITLGGQPRTLDPTYFRIAAADRGRALMVSNEAVALIDLATGAWWPAVVPQGAPPIVSAGLAAEGFWVFTGAQLSLFDPAGTLLRSTAVAADGVADVVGRNDLVALHRCDKEVALLSLADFSLARTIAIAPACSSTHGASTVQQRADGSLLLFSNGTFARYLLRIVDPQDRTLRSAEFPENVDMTPVLDPEARWALVNLRLGYPQLAPLVATRDEVLALAREQLGAWAEEDIDVLLQEPPRR
jgi:hypothetical protein